MSLTLRYFHKISLLVLVFILICVSNFQSNETALDFAKQWGLKEISALLGKYIISYFEIHTWVISVTFVYLFVE